jgi:putative redox protein
VRLESIDIEVAGTRRDEHPRRVTAIHYRFTVRGEGADETKVRLAVALSLEKYCSVHASLATDIRIDYDVVIA